MSGVIKKDPKRGTYGFVVDLGQKPDGSRRQVRRRGFKTQRAADEALTALKSQYNKGEVVYSSNQSLRDFLQYWLEITKGSERVTLKTWERYEGMVRVNLAPALGHFKLKDLKTHHIDIAYINMLKGAPDNDVKGLAPKTVRNIHDVLQQALGRAVVWERLSQNPASEATLPKRRDIQMTVLDREQSAQLINASKGTLMYPVMMLALSTGMRRGELSALQWSNVNLDEGWLNVVASVSETKGSVRTMKPTKTNAGKRRITLPRFVVTFLRQHYATECEKRMRLGLGRPGDDFVLSTEVGEMRTPHSITHFYAKLRDRVRKQNPDLPWVRFHDLRHTHISQLLSDKWPITEVSQRAGHANPSITLAIYAHAIPKADEKFVTAFGSEFEAALERAENKPFENM